MLAPQYRDDAPKEIEVESDNIVEGQEYHGNGHMEGSDKSKMQVKWNQIICLVKVRRKLIKITQYLIT